jgi:hypothetical protein
MNDCHAYGHAYEGGTCVGCGAPEPTKLTPEQQEPYRILHGRWDTFAKAIERSTHPTSHMTNNEQDAWEALVDWIDEQELTYTEYDPRGPQT